MSRKRISIFAVSVIVLALAYSVISAISGPSRPEGPRISSRVESSRRLLAQAEQAASKFDTESALSLATKALEANPDNLAAKELRLTMIRAAADAASESSGSATSKKPGVYDKAVVDIGVLLPVRFRSWNRGGTVSQKSSGVVTFEPKATDAAYGSVVRVTYYVTDLRTASKASSSALVVHKKAYPKNRTTVQVGAIKPAYFGTDGKRLAAVSMARGRYSYEVIVDAAAGTSVSRMKKLALEAASALPATKN